jgi:hypothetical protein
MRLPATCPVLARPSANGIEYQVGIARPTVLRDLGVRERAFLESLEGGRPVSPAEARRFPQVVSLLTAAGAWEPAARTPRAAAVAVHGAGALGMEIAAVLAGLGLDVGLRDEAPVLVEPAHTYAAGGAVTSTGAVTCAGAAAATLSSRGLDVRVGGGGERLGVELCLGAPDPVQTAAWMRDDVPHMLVVCSGESVWVSHVVVPGATACATCRGIALTRADPAWPFLALQLGGAGTAGRRPAASRLATITCAARVASRVWRWLDGGDAGVAERVDADGALTVEELEPQRECGCGAFGPIGDELAARRALWPAPVG